MSGFRYYFAYLSATENFDPSEHARDDEEILTLTIEQEESEAATAKVGVTYREGSFIALGKRAAISCRRVNPETEEPTGEVIPLIVGRIAAAPIGVIGEVVQLELIAKPEDWEARRATVLAGRVEFAGTRYFDPLFFEAGAETDPASVLLGTFATLGWDRVTGECRVDDIRGASDLMSFDANQISIEGFTHELETPLRAVTIEVVAGWQQEASVLSTVAWNFGSKLQVVANQACQDAWPKVGADLGGGWTVKESSLYFGQPKMTELGEIAGGYDSAIYSGDVPVYTAKTAKVVLRNTRKQARKETLRLTYAADVQDLLSPTTETKTYTLRNVLGTGDNIDPWQPTVAYEAGDVVFYFDHTYECRRAHTAGYSFVPSLWADLGDYAGRITSSYFGSERGRDSVAFAENIAFATLVDRNRAARFRFTVPLSDAVDVTISHSVRINTPLVPGETAVGKVVSYSFDASGWAEIEIACLVGHIASPFNVGIAGGWNGSVGSVPRLGPTSYPSTGKVTPLAAAQIASLREAPDAYSLEVRVQIDAPAVPSTYELAHVIEGTGTVTLARQVDLE